jgi:hypothetical protein
MEVVSSLCFGRKDAPEPKLIEILMKMMLTEKQGVISASVERKMDSVPVVTSSLLQLLLEHR